MTKPAVQIAGSAGKGVSNQTVEAVKAVYKEPSLGMTLSQNIALIGKDHIQYLLKLILEK